MNIKVNKLIFIRIVLVLILSIGGNSVTPARATGTTYFVKWNANGANNGTSWTDAYTDLQSAISISSIGDEIWVAAGTYKPTNGTNRDISFTLKNGVAIYGGFIGIETALIQRNYATNATVLSGDIGAAGVNTDNSYHVVIGSNTDSATILDGFTITKGNADASAPLYNGGGIYSHLGNLTLSNLIIKDNAAVFGGGMFSDGFSEWSKASPTLTNVTFINNTSVGDGGGLENRDYSNSTLTNVSFVGNTSDRAGGGMIDINYCNSVLTNVTFSGNTAGSPGGGYVAYRSSNSTLINVTFSNNSSTQAGGGMNNEINSSSTLTNVTFNNNSATTSGGAISNQSSSSLTLTHVTINGNSAVTNGDGVYNNNATLTIQNSILYGNGEEIYGPATVKYSIVQGGYAGTGNLDADPLLDPLQDNGGFTQTMALLPSSPAIDTGDDANCPTTDQRGVTRPQGNHCDIGAYEADETIIPTDTPSPTSTPITPTVTETPSPTPTNTPVPTETSHHPFLKSGALTPAVLISQSGTILGSLSSLSSFDQTGTQDDPAAYVSFQTLHGGYLGYQTFLLPEDAQTKLVSTILLQVNFKGPASSTQVWTWSIYDPTSNLWIRVGDSIGTGPDQWQSLVFRIRQPRRYVTAGKEIRIQMKSNNANGEAKIDYEALHITYLSYPATPTPSAPITVPIRPRISSVIATPRP